MTRLRRYARWFLPASLIAGGIYSVSVSWKSLLSSATWDSILMLWIFGGLMCWQIFKHPASKVEYPDNLLDLVLAYLLLAVFALVFILPAEMLSADWRVSIGLFVLLLAPVCYFSGRFAAFLCSGPIFLATFVIPRQDAFFLMMSGPLRLLATLISANTLKIIGFDVNYSLTTISVPGAELAITDACSGIQQFEAMLLLSYLIILVTRQNLWRGLLHYAFIVPSVVLSNSLRLVLVVICFRWLGNKVLYGIWHEAFGYLQVIVTLLFFYGFSWLLDRLMDDEASRRKQR